MDSIQIVREQIVQTTQGLVRKGFLMATGGNVSMRIPGQDRFAITPSNFDYMQMKSGDVCVLDYDLNPIAGKHKPSIESGMHGAIYQVRPDVNAVIHTHQVYASALALIDAPIPTLFDEQALFLGPSVDIIPYAFSGTDELKNTIANHVQNVSNAFIMKNHGALIFGSTMERAVHNVAILEKCSLAYLLALCTDHEVSEVPLAIREMVIAKIRRDQKKVVTGQGKVDSKAPSH
ncbi:class II aldolase/adducin family protein [Chloroflexota bacterium]|nr:class II aldolase/adducin family protein [Chloroflexota bacterium]